MTKLDKALFAFASYNAGAGRISQLRKEAAKRGLDPNVWFQNVEYVAAEKIGQETVTYVSNIYKYYIAYRLVLERQGFHERSCREDEGWRQIESCRRAAHPMQNRGQVYGEMWIRSQLIELDLDGGIYNERRQSMFSPKSTSDTFSPFSA